MNNSLRDQLLKKGVVSKEQAKQAESQAKAKNYQRQKSKKPTEDKSAAQQAHAEEVARAKELNRQIELERERKAQYAQVKQLIEVSYVNDPAAEIIYHFVHGKWVKHLRGTLSQIKQLANGQLAITLLEEQYYLVPTPIALKILERFPENLICLHNQEGKSEEPPVPDDLRW